MVAAAVAAVAAGVFAGRRWNSAAPCAMRSERRVKVPARFVRMALARIDRNSALVLVLALSIALLAKFVTALLVLLLLFLLALALLPVSGTSVKTTVAMDDPE